MLLAEDKLLAPIKKITCWGTSKELTEAVKTETAKKAAAFNLTLMAGVLSDHIRDNDKFYAKPLYSVMNGIFKKIQKEYPYMWETVLNGYDKMSEIENNGGSVYDIQDCFAKIVEDVAVNVFDIHEEGTLSHLVFVAKNLYFLDAVDDLDKDVKSGAYNPLKEFESKSKLATENYIELSEMVREAKLKLKPLQDQGLNAKTVSRIVHFGMSEQLFNILKGELKA
jgi:hypothetical protein